MDLFIIYVQRRDRVGQPGAILSPKIANISYTTDAMPVLISLLKKGTGSERPTIFIEDCTRSRGACPLFQQAAMPTVDRAIPAFGASPKRLVTIEEARAYCRRLARTHCENFSVVSLLVPRRLRPHFNTIYAYCRGADDLADETGDPVRSLALLDGWERQLRECFEGQASHPVFVALADTVRTFDLPIEPFTDLLTAFRRDQQQTRYESITELLDYCGYSANPVGRLVLRLGGGCSAEDFVLSDSICTGLQLVNFCQDVARDYDRGRIYIPREAWRQYGYDEAMFERHEFNSAFAAMLAAQVSRAESFLLAGLPLVRQSPQSIRLQIELIVCGGLEVVAAIRRIDYNVWQRRPTVSRFRQLRLLAATWWRA